MAFVPVALAPARRTTLYATTLKRPRTHAAPLSFASSVTSSIRRTAFIPTHGHISETPLANRAAPRQQPQPPARTTKPPRALASDGAVIGGITEALEFLAATTIVIPIFRRFNLSPILGFLLAGVVLGPHGLRLIADVEDVSQLAEFGVLFLLFEMGLELSFDRLRKLRKYAFGMGLIQVTLTAIVLGLGAHAMGGSVPESAVIGSALSLSSSAFILQILAEKGERQSRAGVATFGVLLFQDIAVVPLLLLVPFLGKLRIDAQTLDAFSDFSMNSSTVLALRETAKHLVETLGTLNVVVLAGGAFLKRVFAVVANSRSPEAFTSAVLLTVLGTAMFTEQLGLSMTMGAFLAGVLLAESSFRSRIKIDLEPFRGLFLGLFFITTGMSLDMELFTNQPGATAFLIGSLVFWKAAITTLVGLPFGLSLAESVRVGLLLSQGGEFGFVLFALANKLGFLPESVNSFLTTTVVASMALTPLLYEIGAALAPRIDEVVQSSGGIVTTEATMQDIASEDTAYVLICGYGPVGKVVGRMLSRKFIRWVAVDIDMDTVTKAVENNLPVLYGDSARPAEIVGASGLAKPEAFVITQTDDELVTDMLESMQSCFPGTSVYVRAKNLEQQKEFLAKGALALYPETFETSLQLGQSVLQGFNTSRVDISAIKAEVRNDYGLNEVFRQYDDWFKGRFKSTKAGGSEQNGGSEGGEASNGTASNGTAGNGVAENDAVVNGAVVMAVENEAVVNGAAVTTTDSTMVQAATAEEANGSAK